MVIGALNFPLLNHFIFNFLLAGLLLTGGCGQSPAPSARSIGAGSVTITRVQAEAIAKEEASKRVRGHYAIEEASLRGERNWRVVAEFRKGEPFTNIIPANISRSDAEALTLSLMRERSVSSSPRILSTELLEGQFWYVGIDALPPAPGNQFILVISAKDGSVLRSIPGM